MVYRVVHNGLEAALGYKLSGTLLLGSGPGVKSFEQGGAGYNQVEVSWGGKKRPNVWHCASS